MFLFRPFTISIECTTAPHECRNFEVSDLRKYADDDDSHSCGR